MLATRRAALGRRIASALGLPLVTALVFCSGPAPAAAQAGTVGLPSLAEPGISPDGSEIAFVSGGDIWTVSSRGGAARLLIANSADESRPLYSPDGTRLAFNSTRDGGLGIYVMDLTDGEVTRVTYASSAEQLNGWSRDGEWLYFSSTDQDISSMSDVYRVRATGGTPMPVAADRYESEFFAAPAPESGLVAIATRGNMARSQWWRNGHAHIDEAEIWLVREGVTPSYERLSVGGKNVWPMWGADADRLYFMSDRSGSQNLWSVAVNGGAGSEEQLTAFEEGRVLWPSMAVQTPLIAFERDFGIWTYDVSAGRVDQLDVQLVGSVGAPAPEVRSITNGFQGLSVSPDDEKIAFVARGEIFAAALSGEGAAARVTETPAAESAVTWGMDSDRIAYVSWRNGNPQIFSYDFTTEEERQLTTGPGRDASPKFSPNGEYVAFNREGRELRVIDMQSGQERLLAERTSGNSSFVWSPDSRWIAYGGRTDEFSNAMVVSVTGGQSRQVSFLANSNFGSLDWSSTGEYLVFRTGQRTEPGKLVRVDLIPLTPTFQEDRFWDLFNQQETEERPTRSAAARPAAPDAEAAEREPPEDVEVDFDGIRRRGQLVDLDFAVNSVALSPDGKNAAVSGGGGIYYVSLEEDVEARLLTPPGGGGRGGGGGFGGGGMQFSSNGRDLYLLRGGRIQVLNVASGNTRTVSTSAELEVDFESEKRAVFEQGWREMRDGFYDPDFHGADWDRVRSTFEPRVAGAKTPAEMNRIMNLMMGELNASHLGHRMARGGGGASAETGRLGVRLDRGSYEDSGRFQVTEIIELGPAHVAGGIDVGDYLFAVNDVALGASTNLNQVLAETAGTKVIVRISSDPNGSGARDVELQPISTGAERQLVYRSWVEGRRAYVDELSNGRLGYVHIASMSAGALDQLVFDLDQGNHAKEGVVVDVRNNNGGFVNVYAIDIFSRQNYFTMKNRGGVEAPSRVQLGQRALLAPTVLVTNQHTLSDGEDFTEGYRTLGLGKVVGEPTAGWIIYTGSIGLVDGSSVRMPRTEIRGSQGDLMELNPRQVDIEVERPTGESYLGRDSQLERAVEELLAQLAARRTTSN